EDLEHALDRSDTQEVESQFLGELVMERLKSQDHIAYVRFASVYRNFQDLTEFYAELEDLAARTARSEVLRYQRELPLDRVDSTPGAAERSAINPDSGEDESGSD